VVSTSNPTAAFSAFQTGLAELQEQNVSWKEANQMAKNGVHWRKFVMALCAT
jgi:hypothetical protein